MTEHYKPGSGAGSHKSGVKVVTDWETTQATIEEKCKAIAHRDGKRCSKMFIQGNKIGRYTYDPILEKGWYEYGD